MSTQIKSMHSPPDDKEANNHNVGQQPTHVDPNAHLISQVMHPEFQKLGNPGPLGLYSFAITSFMLGLYNCGAGMPGSKPGATNAVLGTAIFMGGIAQFAAGMWEMRVGNTFGATLHSS
ncbi:hypothetical protein TRICI_006032 [Trichomonascus ciferrii]|uniref:Uncharacterized protein n=1 Tax=Trichomonascus ciferrii TaxID=44093 RepID=A0A642UMF7_9ASCO|nr:hypothetical protein TRICI_006032 [Trichomonascus ciferrii]